MEFCRKFPDLFWHIRWLSEASFKFPDFQVSDNHALTSLYKKPGLDLTLKNGFGFLDARLYCSRLWLNHSWLLVHMTFLNTTSFGKQATNITVVSLTSINVSFYRPAPFVLFASPDHKHRWPSASCLLAVWPAMDRTQ